MKPTFIRGKALPSLAKVYFDDNYGVKKGYVIARKLEKGGSKRRYPVLKVGDIAKVVISQISPGKPPEWKGEMEYAIIIHQKKVFKRYDGKKYRYEKNQAIIIDETGKPKCTKSNLYALPELKFRYPKLGKVLKGFFPLE